MNRDELVQYLDDLLDVDLTNVDSGDILRFDDESNLWKNVPMPSFAPESDSSQWELDGDDIVNKNTGKVTMPKDSSYYSGILDEGMKVGRIMHQNQYGKVEYVSPESLIQRIDSGRAENPTAYTIFVRDSNALTVSLVHPTDTVIIGNTLRFSNNEFAMFKSSTNYYFAGAELKGGTGGLNLVGGGNAFLNSTGFGGGNVVLGTYAGRESDSVALSVLIGYYAGYLANQVSSGVFLGQLAGQYSRGVTPFFGGYNAGGLGFSANNCDGDYLIGIGYEALAGNRGTDVIGLGRDAAFENLGSDVVALGRGAGDDNTGNDVILLGRLVGGGNTGNDVNWIGSTHADHSGQFNTASCVNIIGSWDTTNYSAIQPGRTYLGGDLQLFQPFEDSCGTGLGSKIYAENNELEMMGDFIIDDTLFLNSKADAFIVSDGDDLKIENTPAAGDISIVGYTNSTGVTALHFDGDAGEIGIGTNAPSNDIDLTGNVDVNGEMDMTGGNIDNTDTVTANRIITTSISYTDPVPWMDSFRKNAFYFADFFNINVASHDPWLGLAVSSGTGAIGTSVANHPGIMNISGSGSANSGYRIATNAASQVMAGGEIFEIVFRAVDTVNTLLRAGYIDTFTATDQTDGVYIEINSNTTVRGKTAAATTRSTTSTGYVITIGVWYRAKIVVNSDATRVDYYLYNDAGTQLWTNNLTTNIPTDPTGNGFVTLETDAVGSNFIDIDYMSMYLGTLIR